MLTIRLHISKLFEVLLFNSNNSIKYQYDMINTKYDTKQSDGEVPVMLGPWRIRRTPSLPLLLGPLWPGGVAPDRALSMG